MATTELNAATRLLTPEQAAERLGLKPQTLNVWRSSRRQGPAYVKIGSRVMYREADIEAYINSRVVNS